MRPAPTARWLLGAAFALASTARAGSTGASATGDDGAWLGIFADPAGTQSCALLPQGTGTTLYLFAVPGGPVADGIAAAEFRLVVTNPTGYFFRYVQPPDAPVVLGDPFDLDPANDDQPSGVVVGFQECHGGGRVALGTVQVFNSSGGPTEIRVQRRQPSSNPNFVCPLFVACDSPNFTLHCMRPCAVDESGSAIASRLGLNMPGCAPKAACPAACADHPCLQLAATVSSPTCLGSPVTVTATVTNCGTSPADVDVFVEGVLAGSFTGVPAGQEAVASRTYALQSCGGTQIAVGAVATNAACPEPVGVEVQRHPNCSPQCGQNRPPDCTNATLSVNDLWPPDGRLVPIEIVGVTDPDGDPITFLNLFFGSEEWPGLEGVQCPDAFVDGPNRFRLRAERDNGRDGRRYLVHFVAQDPRGGHCDREFIVCVPRKFGQPCGVQHLVHNPASCTALFGDHPTGPVVAKSLGGGGIEVTFETGAEGRARLDVYDIRGRRVAQLAGARFAAGRHVLRWDGRDTAGRAVANGIYVVRLQADGDASTAKVALVR